MPTKRKKRLTMDELVTNAKKVLKGKLDTDRTKFENGLKKVVAPKQRGLK
jgi:hypothetical protein